MGRDAAEYERVGSIEHAAMAGNQVARILDANTALMRDSIRSPKTPSRNTATPQNRAKGSEMS